MTQNEWREEEEVQGEEEEPMGDRELTRLLQRARRKTIIRNVIISVISAVVVLFGALVANNTLLGASKEQAEREIRTWKEITGPNVFLTEAWHNTGFLTGELEYEMYKDIEGIPVIWGREGAAYRLFGDYDKQGELRVPIELPDPEMAGAHFTYKRPYNNQSGQREMLFYHPQVAYGQYLNDVPHLQEMEKDTLVEMGLSFDKAYSVQQVQDMLPQGVHAVWYWVDTYSAGEVKTMSHSKPHPELARQVYGFQAHSRDDLPAAGTYREDHFLQAIQEGLEQEGKYYIEYKRLFDLLRHDKPAPTVEDVRLLGVVATGTAQDLQQLAGQTYCKAAVLGATADEY
ncbi:MAG TPA: anti sigma factor C-terminal domain-containing protein [Bacilli bacterium]|nr:anti sigma factor C-terminal domain-containing protein [Bacilli bacterium]